MAGPGPRRAGHREDPLPTRSSQPRRPLQRRPARRHGAASGCHTARQIRPDRYDTSPATAAAIAAGRSGQGQPPRGSGSGTGPWAAPPTPVWGKPVGTTVAGCGHARGGADRSPAATGCRSRWPRAGDAGPPRLVPPCGASAAGTTPVPPYRRGASGGGCGRRVVAVFNEVTAQVEGAVMVLASRVTAPLRASTRPCTVAPVSSVADVSAMMVPTNVLAESRVAELPTCQNTLHACAPFSRLYDAVRGRHQIG